MICDLWPPELKAYIAHLTPVQSVKEHLPQAHHSTGIQKLAKNLTWESNREFNMGIPQCQFSLIMSIPIGVRSVLGKNQMEDFRICHPTLVSHYYLEWKQWHMTHDTIILPRVDQVWSHWWVGMTLVKEKDSLNFSIILRVGQKLKDHWI